MDIRKRLEENFLKYVAIDSQSDSSVGRVPSSEGQLRLARVLMDDMKALGVTDISLSEYGVVIGKLPARLMEGHAPVDTVGWVAHLDTVNIYKSAHISPVIVRSYAGGDVCQCAETGCYVPVAEHPELMKYIGDDIIFSDGSSVLGADDKAAVTNIMTALELLYEDPSLEHGDIYIAFVPDEEIGLIGAKHMDFDRFPVDYAYTIDCCELGELVYQTFNAASAKVRIVGREAHPMSSKGNLVNPNVIAVDLVNMFDRGQTPEYTEGTEGYIWVTGIEANCSTAEVRMCVRDHDKVKFEAKKEYIREAVELLKRKHPKAVVELEISDTYGNIADSITAENRQCIDLLKAAMVDLGIEPKEIAMRGGTDGSFISTKGILTPNYFTGAHNFHSECEFLPMSSFEKSLQVTMKLIALIAGE